MGSRDFQMHILYYHYLGMTYRSKIILPDGFRSKHNIIKVLDNVIGDFKGPIGRKTYSLLCNEIVSSYYYFFSYRFCPNDFSETGKSIFLKFSGMIDNHKNLIYFFCFDDVTSGFEISSFF